VAAEATKSTTVFFFQPQWLQTDAVAPVHTRVGVHVYSASFSRAQLTAISDRACKVLPEAYPASTEPLASEPVVVHYGERDKVLNVDVPGHSVGVRSVLDAPGAQGSSALFSILRGLRRTHAKADAMVLLFKSQEEQDAPPTAKDPTNASAVIKDAVKAVDVAVYSDVDPEVDEGIFRFFDMLK
jgi:hypothetical protein